LNVRTVIDELENGQLLGDQRHGAHVVSMPMRGNKMVDLSKPRVSCSGDNAPGVAPSTVADVAGVDEQRLLRWRDHERGLPAFDIHDVDLQGASVRQRGQRGGRHKCQHRDER
jgi:hypothetical protein